MTSTTGVDEMTATKTPAIDLAQVAIVLHQAKQAAVEAGIVAYTEIGERDACGFAWVSVFKVRSNSKLGKLLIANGFSRAWNGGLQLWNPSGHGTQSISVKEAGANVYAAYLKNQLGIEAYSGSRMD
jgi:hypothetical protein